MGQDGLEQGHGERLGSMSWVNGLAKGFWPRAWDKGLGQGNLTIAWTRGMGERVGDNGISLKQEHYARL